MNVLGRIQRALDHLDCVPTIPAIVAPLINCLEQPIESVNVHNVVELIAHDKSLAAQCLRMANSPLYGRSRNTDNLREAVVALGVLRMREIALACCMNSLLPRLAWMKPEVFWEHSLGCALVCRRLARRVGYDDPEKAYLAGLLHDLGLVVNILTIADEFRKAYEMARESGIPIHLAEQEALSYDHCASGDLLASHWRLSLELQNVIRWHHNVDRATLACALAAMVAFSDALCRASGLGYGYPEATIQPTDSVPGWDLLSRECPNAGRLGRERLTSELLSYASEVRKLVTVVFRLS